jgi:hypothetical protein
VKVPTNFDSVRQWCEIIAHNLLAEFYYEFQQGASGRGGGGQQKFQYRASKGNELAIVGNDSSDENYVHNLVFINSSVHMVVGQKDSDSGGGPLLKIKPPVQLGGGQGVNWGTRDPTYRS